MTFLTHAPELITADQERTDNDSLSSTFPVDRAKSPALEETGAGARVRFDLASNIIHESNKDYEEIKERWYARNDYIQMKEATKILAKQAMDHDRSILDSVSYRTVLLKLFHACRDTKKDTDCCKLDRKDEVLLKKFLTNAFRVGMESLVVMSIHADKVSRRKHMLAAVLEAQANAPGDLSERLKADFIKRVAEDISRTSRLLAWRVACKQAGLSIAS